MKHLNANKASHTHYVELKLQALLFFFLLLSLSFPFSFLGFLLFLTSPDSAPDAAGESSAGRFFGSIDFRRVFARSSAIFSASLLLTPLLSACCWVSGVFRNHGLGVGIPSLI